MKRLVCCVAALAAAVVLLGSCTGSQDAVAQGGSFEFVSPGGQTDIRYEPPQDRKTIGNLSGEAVRDPEKALSLADYSGQVVVLNIWGSWCGPCRTEAPELERVATETADDGVAVLGIDVRDRRSAARDFMNNYGLSYPSIFDPPGRTLLALGGVPRSVVPTTVVLDRQHRVAAVFLRAVTAEDLLPLVTDLANESA